jgi:hypothetical protein
MSTLPAREVFAAFTRRTIEIHGEWDSLHCFMTLRAKDGELTPGTYAAIDPAVSPPDYPDLMARIAQEELEKEPAEPACAYLLQIEAFGVTEPGKNATEAEVEEFNRARLGRTFHQLPQAREQAIAYCADIHGRLWSAAKVRGREADGISEHFYQPGRGLGGQMIRGLLAVAYATGELAWGLPGPQRTWN